MTINTSISSIRAQAAYRQSNQRGAASLERLSTGLRINHASDDPAGLVAATGLNTEIVKLSAEQTADDRLFLKAAFAEGALGSVSRALLQARQITVQNANTAAMDETQRDANQISLDSIISGIERVGLTASFLGEKLFGGSLYSAGAQSSVNTGTLDPTSLGTIHDPVTRETYSLADLRSDGRLSDVEHPELAAKIIEASIKQIAQRRAELGAFQNTLLSLGDVRSITRENLSAALSQIQDADYAVEAAGFVREQTLSRASLAVSAIANRQSRAALALL